MLSERPTDKSITQLIRSAERLISQQKFGLARNQLDVARQLDPRNSYIGAIIERLGELEAFTQAPVSLVPTIDPRSSGAGILEQDPDPGQTQVRIRHLTSAAEKYLEDGAVDNAFNSLMKAYLLDPVSPYVLSCEKTLLPVWERAHPSHPSHAGEGDSMIIRRVPPGQAAADGLPAPPAGSLNAEQEQRLEALKHQKELERQAHERAVWREASSPHTTQGRKPPRSAEPPETPPERQETGSLFTKLKLGKFLTP